MIGKGDLSLVIEQKTNKLLDTFYLHTNIIKKHNGSLIDSNFFINNKNISGVLFSSVTTNEDYNYKNTFLFLNPFANNRIKIKDFKDIIYWNNNKNHEYIPRCKGKKI